MRQLRALDGGLVLRVGQLAGEAGEPGELDVVLAFFTALNIEPTQWEVRLDTKRHCDEYWRSIRDKATDLGIECVASDRLPLFALASRRGGDQRRRYGIVFRESSSGAIRSMKAGSRALFGIEVALRLFAR